MKLRRMDRVAWTIDETKQFFDVVWRISPYWHNVYSLAMLTGLRAGELYALKWEDVQFEENLIRVRAAYNHKTKSYNPYPKTRRLRWIPINNQLRSLLAPMYALTKGEYVISRCNVFDYGEQSKKIGEFCVRASVPRIRFHDLRAIYATTLLRSGISLINVMQVCGWTQLSTAQRYLRLSGKEVAHLTDGVEFPLGNRDELGGLEASQEAHPVPQPLSKPSEDCPGHARQKPQPHNTQEEQHKLFVETVLHLQRLL